MQLALRIIAGLSFIVAIAWMIVEPGFEPFSAILAGLMALLGSFVVPKPEKIKETLDQRNRRVMLNHMENFWIKGVLGGLYPAARAARLDPVVALKHE